MSDRSTQPILEELPVFYRLKCLTLANLAIALTFPVGAASSNNFSSTTSSPQTARAQTTQQQTDEELRLAERGRARSHMELLASKESSNPNNHPHANKTSPHPTKINRQKQPIYLNINQQQPFHVDLQPLGSDWERDLKRQKRKQEQAEQQRQQQAANVQNAAGLRLDRELEERFRRNPQNWEIKYNEAIILQQKGDPQGAIEKLQWILDAEKKYGGTPQNQGIILTHIALVYNSIGHYSKALKFSEQALAIQKEINDREGEGITFYTEGIIHHSLGQYLKALEYYHSASTVAREMGDKFKESRILVNIGSAQIKLLKPDEAIDSFSQALSILKQRDNEEDIEDWLSNYSKGNVLKTAKHEPKSFEKLRNAIFKKNAFRAISKEESYELEGQALSGIGEAYQYLGDYRKALELYQQALDIYTQSRNKPGKGMTLRKIGTTYVSQGSYSQALDYYQQARAIAKETDDKVEEATTLVNIGFVYNTQGKYPDAEKTLIAAVQAWESLRSGLSDDQKISIFENQASAYQFLQQALVAQNKTNAALEIAERGRARAFVELLSLRISPDLSPDSNNQTSIKPPNIKQIQQIAKQQASTIVQYSIINAPFRVKGKQEWSPSHLYIWVIKSTGEITFRQVDLKSLNLSLVDLVVKSRDLIGARGRGAVNVDPLDVSAKNQRVNLLQQLHQILIQPIISDLSQNQNEPIIFVPQGELFFVPFVALQDEEGKYLIENHTILTAPAIQVLQLTHQQKIKNGKATKTPTLVVGNPTMPSVAPKPGEPPQQLQSLPGAEEEARQIAQILNTRPLTGSIATKDLVKRLMASAGIVHLATHGLLDDFKGSGVPGAIALTPFGEDDGLLTSSEILEIKLNTDLVVLSACDTGRGDIKGDGVIGLSRSLIGAGAPSVIVSLWAVSDNYTPFLMTNFYQNLKQNPNKASALRSAMLTTMKKYPDPLYWAAFTLIGEAE